MRVTIHASLFKGNTANNDIALKSNNVTYADAVAKQKKVEMISFTL